MRKLSIPRPRWVVTIAAGVLVAAAALGFANSALLFKATFTAIPDGPGNGVSFPVEVGALRTFSRDPAGRSFSLVAPSSGVFGEKLRLTDAGGDPTVNFGVLVVPVSMVQGPMTLSFQFRIDVPGTRFSVDILDSTGIDISRVQFGEGGINPFNGPAPPSGKDLSVEMVLLPLVTGDLLVTTLSDAMTGQVILVYTQLILGGVRPVGGVNFTKLGSAPGAFTVDTIRILTQ